MQYDATLCTLCSCIRVAILYSSYFPSLSTYEVSRVETNLGPAECAPSHVPQDMEEATDLSFSSLTGYLSCNFYFREEDIPGWAIIMGTLSYDLTRVWRKVFKKRSFLWISLMSRRRSASTCQSIDAVLQKNWTLILGKGHLKWKFITNLLFNFFSKMRLWFWWKI